MYFIVIIVVFIFQYWFMVLCLVPTFRVYFRNQIGSQIVICKFQAAFVGVTVSWCHSGTADFLKSVVQVLSFLQDIDF